MPCFHSTAQGLRDGNAAQLENHRQSHDSQPVAYDGLDAQCLQEGAHHVVDDLDAAGGAFAAVESGGFELPGAFLVVQILVDAMFKAFVGAGVGRRRDLVTIVGPHHGGGGGEEDEKDGEN